MYRSWRKFSHKPKYATLNFIYEDGTRGKDMGSAALSVLQFMKHIQKKERKQQITSYV